MANIGDTIFKRLSIDEILYDENGNEEVKDDIVYVENSTVLSVDASSEILTVKPI